MRKSIFKKSESNKRKIEIEKNASKIDHEEIDYEWLNKTNFGTYDAVVKNLLLGLENMPNHIFTITGLLDQIPIMVYERDGIKINMPLFSIFLDLENNNKNKSFEEYTKEFENSIREEIIRLIKEDEFAKKVAKEIDKIYDKRISESVDENIDPLMAEYYIKYIVISLTHHEKLPKINEDYIIKVVKLLDLVNQGVTFLDMTKE